MWLLELQLKLPSNQHDNMNCYEWFPAKWLSRKEWGVSHAHHQMYFQWYSVRVRRRNVNTSALFTDERCLWLATGDGHALVRKSASESYLVSYIRRGIKVPEYQTYSNEEKFRKRTKPLAEHLHVNDQTPTVTHERYWRTLCYMRAFGIIPGLQHNLLIKL